ncbi:MAG TPA: hypothetical protein VKU19_05765 [Bryobacteraceae bacterium]|nr:hypothetical protein [Bryobacteraceae bacterium]
MSKKSERLAQLQKLRTAERQRKEGSGISPALAQAPPSQRPNFALRNPLARVPSKFIWPARIALVLVGLSCLCAILSLIFPPYVPTPSSYAFSIVPPVEVVNGSLLPLYRMNYICEFVGATDQAGFTLPPTHKPVEGPKTQSSLYFHQRVPVECVGGMNLSGVRASSFEFRVSLSYFPFLWPIRRHSEYTVRSESSVQGQFLHWVVE